MAEKQSSKPEGRLGYKEICTIPENVSEVQAPKPAGTKTIKVMTNFLGLEMPKDEVWAQYRVTYEPDVENQRLRRNALKEAFEKEFGGRYVFDGYSDLHAPTGGMEALNMTTRLVKAKSDRESAETEISVTLSKVTQSVSAPSEMLRIYNNATKAILRKLGFFQAGLNNLYVHHDDTTPVGNNRGLLMVRGFRTSANTHEQGRVMINLEPSHKLFQSDNVLVYMMQTRQRCKNNIESIREAVQGKLVVTHYKKNVYRVEDVDFKSSPMSTFNRNGRDITYVDYFREVYNLEIRDPKQPLLKVEPSSKRRVDDKHDIYLIPELCNMAGLTKEQETDRTLKMDMIKASQISPQVRVHHLRTFLEKLNNCPAAQEVVGKLRYSIDRRPVTIDCRVIPAITIGMGPNCRQNIPQWPSVERGSFDRLFNNNKVVSAPVITKMVILYPISEAQNQGIILKRLKDGFDRVGLVIPDRDCVQVVQVQQVNASGYLNALKGLPQDFTLAIIVLPKQDKPQYDAVKKFASCQQGFITQVVTARLMTDERKAGGASLKIAIQVAAKIGGEPWLVELKTTDAMICGYDAHHDTTDRNKAYGAFIASSNKEFTKWWSKCDQHERGQEISNQMPENVRQAMKNYKSKNGVYPNRIFIYRDGVGDGQLIQVHSVERTGVLDAIKELNPQTKLTFIVVSKRVGARFYFLESEAHNRISNCPSGTVIDSVVTRQNRYDFYLVSQHTTQGTLIPTYYNILHDESGLKPSLHQIMAQKLTHMYYNWAGPVRVPAPCQYAHKLAYLCGEHLHQPPHASLTDKLHYL